MADVCFSYRAWSHNSILSWTSFCATFHCLEPSWPLHLDPMQFTTGSNPYVSLPMTSFLAHRLHISCVKPLIIGCNKSSLPPVAKRLNNMNRVGSKNFTTKIVEHPHPHHELWIEASLHCLRHFCFNKPFCVHLRANFSLVSESRLEPLAQIELSLSNALAGAQDWSKWSPVWEWAGGLAQCAQYYPAHCCAVFLYFCSLGIEILT